MIKSWKEAAESRDAAVHNMRAGNADLAQTHAVMAIMHLLSADHEPARLVAGYGADKFSLAEAADAINRSLWNVQPTPAMPTHPGVYQDANGYAWFRTAVLTNQPWMDLTRGHCDDRWFTEEYAAQYAPFVRMEAAL